MRDGILFFSFCGENPKGKQKESGGNGKGIERFWLGRRKEKKCLQSDAKGFK